MAKQQEIPNTLTREQIDLINEGSLIILTTVDAESQSPGASAISWVKAYSGDKIRFAVTNKSRIVANVKNNPAVALVLIGLGTVYTIAGKGKVLEEKMDGVALPLAKIEVDIDAVYDSMFWGAKITESPKYEKTYDADKADALDRQVYAALLK
jgi:hypothetical protein